MRILKRKFLALVLSLATIFAFTTNAGAACLDTQTIDLGDNFEVVIVESVSTQPYASTISKTKTASVKYDGTTVGRFSLTSEFAYDGDTAIAIDDDYSATSYGSWDYKNASSSHSGAKVSGKCTFYKGSTSKTVSLSMTCSPSGQIS